MLWSPGKLRRLRWRPPAAATPTAVNSTWLKDFPVPSGNSITTTATATRLVIKTGRTAQTPRIRRLVVVLGKFHFSVPAVVSVPAIVQSVIPAIVRVSVPAIVRVSVPAIVRVSVPASVRVSVPATCTAVVEATFTSPAPAIFRSAVLFGFRSVSVPRSRIISTPFFGSTVLLTSTAFVRGIILSFVFFSTLHSPVLLFLLLVLFVSSLPT